MNNIKLWTEIKNLNDFDKSLLFDDLCYKIKPTELIERWFNPERKSPYKIFNIFNHDDYCYYILAYPILSFPRLSNGKKVYENAQIRKGEIEIDLKVDKQSKSYYLDCSRIFKIKNKDLELCLDSNSNNQFLISLKNNDIKNILSKIKECLFDDELPYLSLLEVYFDNNESSETNANSLYLCKQKLKPFFDEINRDDMEYEDTIHLFYSSNDKTFEYQYDRYLNAIVFGKLFLNEYFDESIVKEFFDKQNIK